LKRELKSRGLSVTGNKDELVERLNTYTHNLLGTGPGKVQFNIIDVILLETLYFFAVLPQTSMVLESP
jgi:hypothetical protein